MKIIQLVMVLTFISIAYSCKKGNSNDPIPKKPPVDTIGVKIPSNVHVIDSSINILSQDKALLNQGIYQYSGNLTFNVDDVIVGESGDGYIRKITNVIHSGNSTTFKTVQANMSNVFKNAQFSINTITAGIAPQSLNKVVLNKKLNVNSLHGSVFSKGSLSVNGDLQFEPNFISDFTYSKGVVHHVALGCQDAQLVGDLTFNIKGSTGSEIVGLDTLYKKSTYQTIRVYGIPVKVKVTFYVNAKYDIKVVNSMSRQVNLKSNTTASLGVIYDDGAISYIHDLKQTTDISATDFRQNEKLDVNVGLIPGVSFEFYGILGPYVNLGFNGSLTGELSSTHDWDFDAEGWLTPNLGINGSIFGFSFDKSAEFPTDHITYKTPVAISKFAGDKQHADPGSKLPKSLQVLVTDSRGKPQSYVLVHFEVKSGGGKLDSLTVLSNSNGVAKTNWTLGKSLDVQKVEAKATKGDGGVLVGTPLTFVANDTLHIGDRAFGGIVAFIDSTSKHGFVVDSIDLAKDLTIDGFWGDRSKYFNLLDIGTTESNNQYILDHHLGLEQAVLICRNYHGGGYSDWYLPANVQLTIMYRVKDLIGGFSLTSYLSCNGAVNSDSGISSEGYSFKDGTFVFNYGNVRAVRRF